MGQRQSLARFEMPQTRLKKGEKYIYPQHP
jgi:hypothetical protein